MAMQSLVCVLLGEWLKWIELGEMRCSVTRIRRIDPADTDAFIRVLDAAPFTRSSEEDAIVIASLRENFCRGCQSLESFESGEALYLPFSEVLSFHAVSHRGLTLLRSEAEGASCALEAPLNEPAWAQWHRRIEERLANQSGEIFVRCLGLLEALDLNNFNDSTEDLFDRSALSSEQRRKHQDRCSLGWAEAFSLARQLLAHNYEAVFKEGPIRELVESRMDHWDLGSEQFWNSKTVAAVNLVENLFVEEGEVAPPLVAIAIFHHYEHLLRGGKPLGERAIQLLAHAMAGVRLRYGAALAAELAYRIGRRLQTFQVARLQYAVNPAGFPAVWTESDSFSLSDLQSLPDDMDVSMPVRPTHVEISKPDDHALAGHSGDLANSIIHTADQLTENVEQSASEVSSTSDHLALPSVQTSLKDLGSEWSERKIEVEETVASAEDVSNAGMGHDGASKVRKVKGARKIKGDSAVVGDLGLASENTASTQTGSLFPEAGVQSPASSHEKLCESGPADPGVPSLLHPTSDEST